MTKDEAIDELCGGICLVTKALSQTDLFNAITSKPIVRKNTAKITTNKG